jgi:hypothetical protein
MGKYGPYSEKQIKEIQKGDNITYKFISDGKVREHVVKTVIPDKNNEYWSILVDSVQCECVFPLDTCDEYIVNNVTILSIVRDGNRIIPEYEARQSVDSNDDCWDEILSLNDEGLTLHNEASWEKDYESWRNDTVKTSLDDNGVHIYRKRKTYNPCDLSRVKHGYFMLIDNATNEWNDNTVYHTGVNENQAFKAHGSASGHMSFEPCSLPSDTFAVKPDPAVFLKTMNGEM